MHHRPVSLFLPGLRVSYRLGSVLCAHGLDMHSVHVFWELLAHLCVQMAV